MSVCPPPPVHPSIYAPPCAHPSVHPPPRVPPPPRVHPSPCPSAAPCPCVCPSVHGALPRRQVLAQAWPFFGRYMEKLLVENVAPSIRASNTHLQTFTFTRVDMGEKVRLPPGLGGAAPALGGPPLPPPTLPLTADSPPRPAASPGAGGQGSPRHPQAADPAGPQHQVRTGPPRPPRWSLCPPPAPSCVQQLLERPRRWWAGLGGWGGRRGEAPTPPRLRSYVGDVQIDVEVKKFFCKAGVKGMQVRGGEPGGHGEGPWGGHI